MPRCELTGKTPVAKNKVSHSKIRTRSKAFLNIQRKTLSSESLQRAFSLKVSTRTLRTVEKRGGLDAFLMKQTDDSLSPKALKIKQAVRKKLGQKKKGAKTA